MSQSLQVQDDADAARRARYSEMAKRPRKPRALDPRTETAIKALCFNAWPVAKAAEHAGMTPRALNRAIKKPNVQAAMREIERARNENWQVEALVTGVELMRCGASEHVRLQAAQWIAEKTDPNAGANAKNGRISLILNINPQGDVSSRLVRDERSGTVRAAAIDVDAEPVE